MSTVWRHFAAVPITGLLLASTATIAMADTVNPPEGGVWRYGRGYSDYLHAWQFSSRGQLCALAMRQGRQLVLCSHRCSMVREQGLVSHLLTTPSQAARPTVGRAA